MAHFKCTAVALGLALLLLASAPSAHSWRWSWTAPTRASLTTNDVRVNIELFVMSRCPDALRAEARFDEVLALVHPIATVQLHYIGSVSGGFVQCRHGILECRGNLQQLCVADNAPGDENYDSFWKFVQCQNAQPIHIGEVSLAEECLAQLPPAVSEPARACMAGEGSSLLRQDVARTEELGVTRSCTVFIDGKKRCVHDGGVWYDCPGGSEVQDFVNSVCDAYFAKTGTWPDVCPTDTRRTA